MSWVACPIINDFVMYFQFIGNRSRIFQFEHWTGKLKWCDGNGGGGSGGDDGVWWDGDDESLALY